jgi:hypothetical protein
MVLLARAVSFLALAGVCVTAPTAHRDHALGQGSQSNDRLRMKWYHDTAHFAHALFAHDTPTVGSSGACLRPLPPPPFQPNRRGCSVGGDVSRLAARCIQDARSVDCVPERGRRRGCDPGHPAQHTQRRRHDRVRGRARSERVESMLGHVRLPDRGRRVGRARWGVCAWVRRWPAGGKSRTVYAL